LPSLPLADRRLDGPGRLVLASGADALALHAEASADWQVLTAAALVGLADRALALAVAHVKQRVQFGVAIGSFQAIQHRLADRATELEGARLLAWRAAWAGSQRAPDRLAWAAAALLFASETARATTAAALQYHGGKGYTLEHDIQLFHRRAKGWPLVLGDAAEQWRALGALLYCDRAATPAAAPLADGIDFRLGPRSEAFRAEVRAFLDAHLTPEIEERTHRTGTMHDWGFHRALAARGWIGAAWPVALGGQGRDPWEMRVFAEECARYETPTDALATTMMVAGTLREVASEEMKREVLPRVLAGEVTICLGYSEPEAGSDLANVRTRAVHDGDGWIIEGEKAFTSLAHEASYVFLLTRTNPDAPKHRGLTMFLVPMSTPGISVEPVYTLGAPGRTNRTFYRDVRVPDTCRVGEVDGGWKVVNVALTLERGGMFGAVRSLEQARRFAEASGRLADPEVRARLARVWTQNEVAALLGLKVTWASAGGAAPGIESTLSKLFATESTQRSCNDLLELLGAEGLLPETEDDAPAAGAVEFEWRKAAVGTIYAGTSEVMRGIIAERHLGLPRMRGGR
jgi:alkylation response protein AidB-like acyl-CoA dehydrogenase